jgi:hypothetical protein
VKIKFYPYIMLEQNYVVVFTVVHNLSPISHRQLVNLSKMGYVSHKFRYVCLVIISFTLAFTDPEPS